MKNKAFTRYYLLALLGLLVASFYPLYMGVRVIWDMIAAGTVMKENYPKYIIPYTPISIGLLVGMLLLPLCMKLFRRFALVGGSVLSVSTFFASEWLFENKVVVTTAETIVVLQDWQMYMCFQPAGGWPGEEVTTYKQQTAVEILMGQYSPAFKLHFYLISVVLILAVLNCLYGFGHMAKTGNKSRLKALILQSAASALFLGLCILACFTAFWRDGSLLVSPLSAFLMAVFFILLGVTVGIFLSSLLLGKKRLLSVWLPAIAATATTTLMYLGEMVLLSGYVYRLGVGFFFKAIPGIALAPVDILIILLAGSITAITAAMLNKK